MKAALLAGGNSKRMGLDKSLLIIEKKTLIELITLQLLETFEQVIIITNKRLKPIISNVFNKYLSVNVHEDLIPDKGPMGGLYTAFNLIKDDVFFLTACDIAIINRNTIELMREFIKDYDVISPKMKNKYEPMFAFYSRSAFQIVTVNIKEEKLSMQKLLAELNTKEVTPEMLNIHQNEEFGSMNTKDEFNTMLPILRKFEKKYTK